jgi:transposase
LRSYAAKLQRALTAPIAATPQNREGAKLHKAIKKVRHNLFVFLEHRDVPATNNGSEQALRPCVIFRKVTNCFRSQWGAELYADIRSVLETARRRCIGALDSIRVTLAGAPLTAAT